MAFIFFSCEKKVKKLYFIFAMFLPICCIYYYYYYYFYIKENINIYALFSIQSLSKILIVIPYLFSKKCRSVKRQKMKSIINISKKDITIFFLNIVIYFIKILFNTLDYVINYTAIFEYLFEIITIITISLLMKFINNFIFFSHHKISFSIYISIAVVSVIFCWHMKIIKLIINTSILLFILAMFIYTFEFFLEGIVVVYYKYLMENKNLSFYIACSFGGFLDIIFTVISLLLLHKKFQIKYFDISFIINDIKNALTPYNFFILFFSFVYQFLFFYILYEYQLFIEKYSILFQSLHNHFYLQFWILILYFGVLKAFYF